MDVIINTLVNYLIKSHETFSKPTPFQDENFKYYMWSALLDSSFLFFQVRKWLNILQWFLVSRICVFKRTWKDICIIINFLILELTCFFLEDDDWVFYMEFLKIESMLLFSSASTHCYNLSPFRCSTYCMWYICWQPIVLHNQSFDVIPVHRVHGLLYMTYCGQYNVDDMCCLLALLVMVSWSVCAQDTLLNSWIRFQ